MSPTREQPDGLVLLVALVPFLRRQDGPISVDELATQFGTSPKHMRETVRLLAMSGAPGDSGAYLDADLFDIDWDLFEEHDEVWVTHFVALEHTPNLSNREAAALLAGIQQLRSAGSLVDAALVERVTAKLTSATPSSTFDRLASISPEINDATSREAQLISTAIASSRRVRFLYASPTSPAAVRTVDPASLEAIDGDRYLSGWCLERDALRRFRLDRMRDLEVLEDAAEEHEIPVTNVTYTPGESDVEVQLRVAESVMPQVREFLPPSRRIPKPDATGWRSITVQMGSLDALSRLVAANAGQIVVVSPNTARDAVRQWSETALATACQTAVTES